MQPKKSQPRIPQQSRSILTQQKIMHAALRLFSCQGLYKTTAQTIAAKAGVPVGSFYAYFQDKQALFRHLLEEYNKKFFKKISFQQSKITMDKNDKKAFLRAWIQAVLAAHDHWPKFYLESKSVSIAEPLILKICQKKDYFLIQQIESWLACWKEHWRVSNPHLAAQLIARLLDETVYLIHTSPKSSWLPEWIAELTDMLNQYLFTEV